MVDRVNQVQTQQIQQESVHRGRTTGKVQFSEILQRKLAGVKDLKFSAHAQERLRLRNIEITPQHIDRIREAVDLAATKGARESLVLIDRIAFIVSIKNRTVITAIDEESIKGNVFTNIDSAVIM